MFLSLVVASLTRFQVMAMAWINAIAAERVCSFWVASDSMDWIVKELDRKLYLSIPSKFYQIFQELKIMHPKFQFNHPYSWMPFS